MIYTFDLVLKPKSPKMGKKGQCPPGGGRPLWLCHMAVFQGLEKIEPPHREVLWDKTNCARKYQLQDNGDQGEYCIYHSVVFLCMEPLILMP